jgi:hypothetical protein
MKKLFSILFPLLLLLSACSEAPKKAEQKKEPEKPAEPVTARTAFQQIFATARSWAPDAQILQIVSLRLPGVKEEPGKAAAWQAAIVSPSRGRVKMFTYSVVESAGNLHKGVFGTPDDAYTQRGQSKPFPVAALKVDTDKALEAAMKKAGDYVKKKPDKPITYLLELTAVNPNPAWRVIWGESIGSSNFSIFVDASSGEYLKTMH